MTTILPDDEFNRVLAGHVHPPDWVNPTPAPRYNLVVVGAGPAGLITAIGASGLGARVALIERAFMGGDCLNVGCIPSKALIRSARVFAAVRDAEPFGVHGSSGASVHFDTVMQRMRRLRSSISVHDSAARYRALGVDVFLGTGRFVDSSTAQVGDARLRFSKAVIATGARSAIPEIPGLVEAGFLTNETVFNLTELPRRLAILGAGPIGCELAQVFARLGAQVTLLGRAPQILPREDRDAASRVESSLQQDGIALKLACRIDRAELRGTDRIVHFECAGIREELAVDAIVVGAGRTPNVETLALEAAGVEFDARTGVHVDDRLRTTNPRIYAAGDVCSRFQFTHAADAMARIVIRNSLFGGRAKASRLVIPWCTYTDPEIAHVGLSEAAAAQQGLAIDTFVQELSGIDRAILDSETAGFVKIHVRKGTDRLIGATIVAPHAGEMISEITLAMTAGLGLKALGRTIHPFPTYAEAIRRTADAYNRTRLSPVVKSLFEKWLAWGRR